MPKRTRKGFADKTAKALKDYKKHCSVCGVPIEMVKHIVSIIDTAKNSVRFQEKMVGVCKCNRSQVFK